MAGIYGNNLEDKYFENKLINHVDDVGVDVVVDKFYEDFKLDIVTWNIALILLLVDVMS